MGFSALEIESNLLEKIIGNFVSRRVTNLLRFDFLLVREFRNCNPGTTMIAVEATSRQFNSHLLHADRQDNKNLNSPVLQNSQMEILLFDTNPIRRKDWSKLCQKRSVTLHCLDSITDSIMVPAETSRICVFDKTVVEDSVHLGKSLIARMPYNVVAFSLPQCSVAVATRLMKYGARWVFDNELEAGEFEAGFSALLQDSLDLNEQLRQFKQAEALRSDISPGEKEVLELVIKGVPNKTIAAQLDISTRTVEARRARVYRKCGVQSITELVRFFDQAEDLKKRFIHSVS